MHGRQKKERTAEEEAAKEKERCKKVAAYRYAMGLILSKREKKELDEELLKITGQVLASNPDISTLWNIRKEVLTVLKETDFTNFSDVVVQKELDFSEFCLKSNPKSYGAWHHRVWLMRETNFSKVTSELKLCAKYLEYDDRNFHCWDYRRYLVENCSEVTLEQEFDFTTEKISSNFSNFSSWHLRSKILPKLPRDFLDEELELIRNAVFTDPKDQSAWFYHRWLLRSQLPTESPYLIAAQYSFTRLILTFSSKAPTPSQLGVKVVGTDKKIEGIKWTNPWSNTCSKLWECELQDENKNISVQADSSSMMRNFGNMPLSMKIGDIMRNFPNYFDTETEEKNDKLLNLLKEEIAWVQELQELEPDVKWPICTLIMLMRMVDFVGYKQSILTHLDSLMKLDSKRVNYYLDLRSKYLIEWKLVECSNTNTHGLDELLLDLSGLNLTALYYPERMCFHTKIDLSNNALKNCEPFRALVNCKELNLSGNELPKSKLKKTIKGLENLKIEC
ncbi:Geranylgeranyl transferase type-2 subunit alpha [Orchesella cincta]|uniref:Geranylgeranyl transferase type-2 subunit alpha n=1 Tax=Orchesella cincta TaxID=48709 RepID=A0A1D2N9C4_ORCCI|nr:Geranylgeranyl transferase type-2 subunit alpha [Orchesella cincta]